MGFFSKTLDKLKGALKKTAQVLNTDVRTLFIPGRQIDDAFLAEMEEKFIRSDMGVKNVTPIVAEVRERWRLGKIKNAEDAEGAENVEGRGDTPALILAVSLLLPDPRSARPRPTTAPAPPRACKRNGRKSR